MHEIDIMDIGGFKIGQAEDTKGLTGCTVFLFDKQSPAGVDIRGGGTGFAGDTTFKSCGRRKGYPCSCTVRRLCLWSGCSWRRDEVSRGARYRL